MDLREVARDCLILAGENTYNRAEAQSLGAGGSAMSMQEEYNDVRLILIGKSTYGLYQ